MDTFSIEKYQPNHKKLWYNFVANSKNATFLHFREFMDYHSDRFDDYSVMVFKKDKLVAILPANKNKDAIHSHQGLSYAGLLLPNAIKFKVVLDVLYSILKHLDENGFGNLYLKTIPYIYHSQPSDEIDYMAHILQAEITTLETLSVLNLQESHKCSSNRMEGVKRGAANNLIIKEEEDFERFWKEILEVNLQEKYGAEPVHGLDEIHSLKKKFPKNIRQFNVYHREKLVAGTTIFESNQVAHCQYISANSDKNSLGSLDFLHHHLINNVFKDKRFYDFGSSNENRGKTINQGLQFWKEGFGARIVLKKQFHIKTKNYHLLENVLK